MDEGDEYAGKLCEPIEQLVVDCPSECQNDVMSLVMNRKAEIVSMDPKAGRAITSTWSSRSPHAG